MDERFLSLIDEHIHNLVKDIKDFREVVYRAKGVYPTEVLESLKRLAKKNIISDNQLRNYIQQAHCFSLNLGSGESFFPHYLDSDWRFCQSGLEKLAELIDKQVVKENMTIAFVGTPKLFLYYINNINNGARCILYDKNASEYEKNKIKDGECYECVIPEKFDSHGLKSADIIILDPPWYLEKTIDFLDIANQISALGTMIFCVIPPIYTRPTILEERDIIKNFCESKGLWVKSIENAVARYVTPQFEANSLRVNGIFCDLNDWRVGDVLTIEKKVSFNTNQKLHSSITHEVSFWKEIEIKKVRIKYKQTKSDISISRYDIDIDSIFQDDVYPSVSKRYQTDFDINVWTSGNRVFHCNNIPLLEIILQNLYDDMRLVLKEKGVSEIEYESIVRCQQKLFMLVWREIKEYVM